MVHHDDSFCSWLANGDAKYFYKYSFVRRTRCNFHQATFIKTKDNSNIKVYLIFQWCNAERYSKSHDFWQKINQYLLYLIIFDYCRVFLQMQLHLLVKLQTFHPAIFTTFVFVSISSNTVICHTNKCAKEMQHL